MLSNWIITLYRIHVFFLLGNARKDKKALSKLKTSSVPCIIYTLQPDIKDPLFEDDRLKLVLAKVKKLVFHISRSSNKIFQMAPFKDIKKPMAPNKTTQKITIKNTLNLYFLPFISNSRIFIINFKVTN